MDVPFRSNSNHDKTRTAAIVAPSHKLLRRPILRDTYHHLVSMSWPRFLLVIGVLYAIMVLVFGVFYESTHSYVLMYEDADGPDFLDALHFSYVTLTTVGFGDIRPIGVGRLVTAFEAVLGVVAIGMFSAMAFVRLSRVAARLTFSKQVVLGQHVGRRALMFRVTNLRLNELLEVQVRLYFMWIVRQSDGGFQRRWTELELLPNTHPILQFTWMVVAPLTPESELAAKSLDEIQAMDGLLIAVVRGHDLTLGADAISHFVWTTADVIEGKFRNVLRTGPDGRPMPVPLAWLDEVVPVDSAPSVAASAGGSAAGADSNLGREVETVVQTVSARAARVLDTPPKSA